MKIRIYNAKILTMAEGEGIIEGEIQIEGNRVAYVGTSGSFDAEALQKEWDREIDAKGNLVMPGFKNAHTHSGMTFLRSYADDLPLNEWLNEQVFPMEAKLTEEDIYHLSKLAIMEYLTSGITANFDMYLTPDAIAEASKDCGFRTVIAGAMNDFTQSPGQLANWYEKYNHDHELISFCLGFHAEYTTSEKLLKEVALLAHNYHAPVYTHNSETVREVEECRVRTGMTPTGYLESLGMFEYGGGGYHGVYLTEEDMDIFKKHDLSVVTNPASNMKLASGIAPIARLMERGINLAIGTDGPASNNCLDMFREMFLVTGLAKYRDMDAASTDAIEVLKMATVNGAKAMGLTDSDVLAPGKYADLIMIDMHQPNMQPINNIAKNIVYSGSKQNVKMTMIDGKILYEDGKFFIGEDPEKLYAKANEIADRLRQE